MIEFHTLHPEDRALYQRYLFDGTERGCEFSFPNHYLWGRQQAAEVHGHLVIFSQFSRRTVYPYPLGTGDKRAVLDAIIADARERGIPCRITGITGPARETLERLYPGKFRFHCDRDSYDYVYAIDDLADLKGRKYQKKRNHLNRFRQSFPNAEFRPLDETVLPAAAAFVEDWYAQRLEEEPDADLHMEHAALKKALRDFSCLAMEGMVLLDGDKVLALTLGSQLSEDTFDIHFEKADSRADGAYTAINCHFAQYLREKYPHIRFLNREEDMGLEGLRKAKLSYCPHHLVEKCWACLLEDGYDY